MAFRSVPCRYVPPMMPLHIEATDPKSVADCIVRGYRYWHPRHFGPLPPIACRQPKA